MRSHGPVATKETGREWLRRMSHRVDPAAIAEEARTVRLDAVLKPPPTEPPGGVRIRRAPDSPQRAPILHGLRAAARCRQGDTWVLVPTLGPGADPGPGKIRVTGSETFRRAMVDLIPRSATFAWRGHWSAVI
jgi:hypothetical protein